MTVRMEVVSFTSQLGYQYDFVTSLSSMKVLNSNKSNTFSNTYQH